MPSGKPLCDFHQGEADALLWWSLQPKHVIDLPRSLWEGISNNRSPEYLRGWQKGTAQS